MSIKKLDNWRHLTVDLQTKDKPTMFVLLIILLSLVSIFGLILNKIFTTKSKSIKGKHVLITGGSSGIGKSLAILAVKSGANVTIVARNEIKLKEAIVEIKSYSNESQKISFLVTDVTNYKDVSKNLNAIEQEVGPIYMLVNCAGLAICGKVEDLSLGDIRTMTETNFYGSVFSTQLVVKKMKERREGIIVFTASQAALLGIYGLTVYSATKFALRGFAEALEMEVKPYNVSVTVALPPDTDTEGYHKENLSKPLETKLISESGGLYKPDQIAELIINDALKSTFFSYIGMESFMLTNLCVGMSKCSTLLEFLVQTLFLGLFRFIALGYRAHFSMIIKNSLKRSHM